MVAKLELGRFNNTMRQLSSRSIGSSMLSSIIETYLPVKEGYPITSVVSTIAAVNVSYLHRYGTSLFSLHGEHWHLVLKHTRKAAFFASQ